jgi:putative ABC transport system ATP-binding protein
MKEVAAITLEAAAKHYRTAAGWVRAVDAIDVVIESGTSVAIVGPSGCGKSTLLGLIGGLESPSGGRVLVHGQDLGAMSESQRARYRRDQVGFVFQSYDLLAFLTAAENVAFQLSLHGERDGRARSLELLESLGLEDHADKLPDQLSGGQRQRVGIARALAHHPRLILADEPTGELDSQTSTSVMDILVAAQQRLGATLVVVSHDHDVAERLDRVLVMRDGQLVLPSITVKEYPRGA